MWTVTNKHCHGYKKTDLHVGCFSYIVIVSNVVPISKGPIQPRTIHHEIARDERNLECPTLEFCGSISTSLLRRVVRDHAICLIALETTNMGEVRGVSKLKVQALANHWPYKFDQHCFTTVEYWLIIFQIVYSEYWFSLSWSCKHMQIDIVRIYVHCMCIHI